MVLNYDLEKTKKIVDFSKDYWRGEILDLGCNEAILSDFLDEKHKPNYEGMDADLEAINKAKKNGKKVRQLDLNKQKIPLKNNSKETVFALDILEHLIEPENALKEIHRVLKKGGNVIISIPHDYYLVNFLRMFLLDKPIIFESSALKKGTHIHFLTLKMSRNLVSKYFQIKKTGYFGSNVSVPFLSQKMKNMFANLFPRFFASNVFYIATK